MGTHDYTERPCGVNTCVAPETPLRPGPEAREAPRRYSLRRPFRRDSLGKCPSAGREKRPFEDSPSGTAPPGTHR
jgi:hypothetical protein